MFNSQEATMHMELPRAKKKTLPGVGTECILILITIKDYHVLKEMYGQGFIDQVVHELRAILDESVSHDHTLPETEVFLTGPGEAAFVVPCTASPMDIAYEYKIKGQEGLKQTMYRQTGLGIDLGMGYVTISGIPSKVQDGFFDRFVNKARKMAHIPLDMKRLSIADRFNTILTKNQVTTHYQPILNFKTGKILGWEALTRGPRDSSFRSPIILFETAEQLGRLFALEKICRESALRNAGELQEDQKLFVNISPKTMADPEFSPGNTLKLMESVGLTPDNVVFEITEQHSVQEFDLFYRTLAHYRSQGFRIAVDDAGSGYAGLSTIAELQPEFIKLDKSLINGIHKDPVKRALVETTTTFADKIGSRIIAEGVETKAQAICLKDIGVHCGQGYFFARPARPKPPLTQESQELQSVTDITNKAISCSLPIGDLAQPPHSIPPDHMVAEAQNFFKKNNRFSSIIVTEDEIPRGLVMEYHLNRQLSSQYGIALYFKRPVADVMDGTPLIVDIATPVEQAARQAMKREPLKAYDDIIITRRGYLYGVVSVQNLLNAMAKIQVEMAKGTNPLTGLPGNVAIEKEVESRMAQKRCFSIIYADLDYFKVYNDTYGFKNGDGIIKLAADILSWATKKYAPQDAELCHIGGDDFVLITSPESVQKITKAVIRCFGRLVKNCYCVEDRNRGWIKARGRDGKERNHPLVSISLGVISICGQCSLMEIGERAAHIKKYAKSKPGNSVAIDRRPPLGSQC
jgi:diguanylate cyclase (GGDEF)-like protein